MDRIERLCNEILNFREERDWKKFHTPENLAKSISIEAAELLEHFQWGDQINFLELKDELADVLIYSFLLADAIDVSVEDIILDKLNRNKERFPIAAVKGNSGKHTKIKGNPNE